MYWSVDMTISQATCKILKGKDSVMFLLVLMLPKTVSDT